VPRHHGYSKQKNNLNKNYLGFYGTHTFYRLSRDQNIAHLLQARLNAFERNEWVQRRRSLKVATLGSAIPHRSLRKQHGRSVFESGVLTLADTGAIDLRRTRGRRRQAWHGKDHKEAGGRRAPRDGRQAPSFPVGPGGIRLCCFRSRLRQAVDDADRRFDIAGGGDRLQHIFAILIGAPGSQRPTSHFSLIEPA